MYQLIREIFEDQIVGIIPATGWRAVLNVSDTDEPEFVEKPLMCFVILKDQSVLHDDEQSVDLKSPLALGVWQEGFGRWATSWWSPDFVSFVGPGQQFDPDEADTEDLENAQTHRLICQEKEAETEAICELIAHGSGHLTAEEIAQELERDVDEVRQQLAVLRNEGVLISTIVREEWV